MDDISGSKKLNQKGYLLIESLVAFSLVSMCIASYIPFIVGMLKKIDTEKTTVEMHRIQYEQIQKIEQHQAVDSTWKTGGKVYTINPLIDNSRKGVRITYENEEIFIEVRSFQTFIP